MKRPNLKLMQTVHSEARIKQGSQILSILNDIDSSEYFNYRMIEAIRMAQTDPDNADAHLCLVSQLCTIARTKLREDNMVKSLSEKLKEPVQYCNSEKAFHDSNNDPYTVVCRKPINHEGRHEGASGNYTW